MVTGNRLFGHTPERDEVFIFTLENLNGIKISITNYGGIVTSLITPDKRGNFHDVVLGFDNLDDYLSGHPHFGTLTGRVANRISNARFELDGQVHQLDANNGLNHLHGGNNGIDKRLWEYNVPEGENSLELTYLSPHGEEGYPGNLLLTAIYSLNNNNEFKITYRARTDRATPVNITHHGYFNFTGGKMPVLGHHLQINASRYTPAGDDFIPTGEISPVEGTPLDFRIMKPLGRDMGSVEGGYDHNYVLDENNGMLQQAAILYEPDSGRKMELFTTQPGMQLYTANFLDGSITGRGGQVYHKHWGVCLETQHFPDSPNKPSFPDIILKPEEEYSESAVFRFSAE
jgi:aldose 1-epimerase